VTPPSDAITVAIAIFLSTDDGMTRTPAQTGEEDVSDYEPMKSIRRPERFQVADLVKLDGLKAKP
jgi:hypothetical protein